MVSRFFIFADFEILVTGHAGNDTNLKTSKLWAGTFLGIVLSGILVTFMVLFPITGHPGKHANFTAP